MGVVKKNTLGRFLEKIKNIDNYELSLSNIADKVADIGLEIAQEEYAGTQVDLSKAVNDNSVELVAKAKGIAYMEFGTGIIGEGQYKGNLPPKSMVLEFESPKGVPRKTEGWVYDYMKKLYYPDKPSFKGQKPQAQMFNTSRRIQKELSERIVKEIKGE